MTRSRLLRAAALWILLVAFVNSINATSVLMERARQGPSVDVWEPFAWEYSSGLATLALVPLILMLDRRRPFRERRWRGTALVHVAATVPFSLLHVALMVGMRKLVYALAGSRYVFGNVPVELLYEYRKDFITYFVILGLIYGWRLYRARRRGAVYDEAVGDAVPTTFSIRDRDRVTRVAAADIDWIEAAGNYVLLHVGAATHPLRETMKGIEARLGDAFCRIHRSILVNVARIERTRPAPGGALYVRLTDGTELKCGRTSRHVLLERLEARAHGVTGDERLPA